MDREEAFEFLDRTARGIAEMFGSTCETLVHDMGDPSIPSSPSTTAMCRGARWLHHGHPGHRQGAGRGRSGNRLRQSLRHHPIGQQIKSSTFHLIGEGYNLALGINFDYSSLVYANRILVDLMSAEADLQSACGTAGTAVWPMSLTSVWPPLASRSAP